MTTWSRSDPWALWAVPARTRGRSSTSGSNRSSSAASTASAWARNGVNTPMLALPGDQLGDTLDRRRHLVGDRGTRTTSMASRDSLAG